MKQIVLLNTSWPRTEFRRVKNIYRRKCQQSYADSCPRCGHGPQTDHTKL